MAPAVASEEKTIPPVVWVTGCPCAGKTFLGDYLADACGFTHIDGDGGSYGEHEAAKAAWTSMLQAFGVWFRGEEAPPELWSAFYEDLCCQAAAAAAKGGVVVTAAIYPRVVRDFIRAEMAASGVPVLFVGLTVSGEELARRNLARLDRFLEGAGLTHEEFWASDNDPNVVAARADFGQEWSPEVFKRWQLERVYHKIEPLAADEPGVATVQNESLESPAAIDALHALLGLQARSKPVPAERIAAINFERLKRMQVA